MARQHIGSMAAACALVLALATCTQSDAGDPSPSSAPRVRSETRTFSDNDPIARGCALNKTYLRRIWNGYDPAHSEDVTIVPQDPNYTGSFNVTSHSGPWNYLQRVPLVFYGPGHIKAGGRPLEGPATLADVAPTVAELTGTDFPQRAGHSLNSVLDPKNDAPPKLIVSIMWDGVGRNVLERWPDAWPNLARLEREGSSIYNAFVGSSPSITPATHSTFGTGTFPRSHGVTAIQMRDGDEVRSAFAGRDPADLRVSTFGDEIDLALANEPLVGLLAWKSWHFGMFGHGSAFPGGDKDQVGLIGTDEHITGNPLFYDTPEYLDGFPGLQAHLKEVDRSDGKVDGKWRGNELERHDNPAWIGYQSDALLTMLRREGYGRDSIPDLFFTNFKMADIAGHHGSMDTRNVQEVLAAQDDALGRLLDYLDDEVRDYVVILTADHGHTPSTDRTGAWPLLQGQLGDDIDSHFGVTKGSLVTQTTAVGPFLDHGALERHGVTADDVARFLNGYTIRDNFGEEQLPEGYADRGDENVLSAAWPSRKLPQVMKCAFGRRAPQS